VVEYERKEWLEEAILEYVGNNEGVDSADVVSHLKLRCDITLMSLRYLVDSGKISETQPYMKFEYRLNK